jgi:hypothetical protein
MLKEYKFNVGDKVIGSATALKDCGNTRDEVGLVLTVKALELKPAYMNFYAEEDDYCRAHQHWNKVS